MKFVPADLTDLAQAGLFGRLIGSAREEQEDRPVRVGNDREPTNTRNIFGLAMDGSADGFHTLGTSLQVIDRDIAIPARPGARNRELP